MTTLDESFKNKFAMRLWKSLCIIEDQDWYITIVIRYTDGVLIKSGVSSFGSLLLL